MKEFSSCDVLVIGGGAAGFFAAINAKINYPDKKIVIVEKTAKVLSKVRISGGGRCNVTHSSNEIAEMLKGYPRGKKILKTVFRTFFTTDLIQWFEDRGVFLKTEKDGRMFPISDDSQTIVNCFLNECQRLDIPVILKKEVVEVIAQEDGFQLAIKDDETIFAEKVIITVGGYPKKEQFNWIQKIPKHIEEPYPSLFTFNLKKHKITELMGVSVPLASVKIPSLKLMEEGPILITHWGISGPGVIKLSAWAARELKEQAYKFEFIVNFLPDFHADELGHFLMKFKQENPTKSIKHKNFSEIPQRLWNYFLEEVNLKEEKWGDVNKKAVFRLAETISNHHFQADGKTTFKEEFVSAGGVQINQVNPHTMESKTIPNLYFAGECLDIDGVTGGFNFQAAWSTAYVASLLKN